MKSSFEQDKHQFQTLLWLLVHEYHLTTITYCIDDYCIKISFKYWLGSIFCKLNLTLIHRSSWHVSIIFKLVGYRLQIVVVKRA